MPPAHPLVHVIVLTWNGKQDTLDCLASLSKLTFPNFKTVVVDNASLDGTAEAVRAAYPNVHVIVNDVNLRFAGGNNVGITYALNDGADYVLLLNNDTVVDPDFLTELVRTAESNQRIGMAGPKIYYHDAPKVLWYAGGKIAWWKGWITHRGVREPDHGQYDTAGETDYVTGCCVLVRRAAIEQAGMLDEAFFIYGEDADWSVRVARADFKLLYVPQAVIWHKLSVSTGGHLSWFKNWNKLKSQLRLLARYAKPYHWITIPFGIVFQIVAGLISSKRVMR